MGFLAFLVLFNLARSAGDSMVAITLGAVFLAALTLFGFRSLMIQRNPFQLAMFANCCVVTLCMLALGLEWLPWSFAMLPSVARAVPRSSWPSNGAPRGWITACFCALDRVC